MALALFAIGFTAVIGQVLLMRELVATFYGNELLFGLILAVWLAWGAAGSAVAGLLLLPQRVDKIRSHVVLCAIDPRRNPATYQRALSHPLRS